MLLRLRWGHAAGPLPWSEHEDSPKTVIALGAGSLAAPFALLAQNPGRFWRVGFLTMRSRPDSFDTNVFGAFRAGLREVGYVEGNNQVIEW